jgi:hypothetical protein
LAAWSLPILKDLDLPHLDRHGHPDSTLAPEKSEEPVIGHAPGKFRVIGWRFNLKRSGPEPVLRHRDLIPTNHGVETISVAPPAKRARPHRVLAAEHPRCRLQLSVAAPKTRQGR